MPSRLAQHFRKSWFLWMLVLCLTLGGLFGHSGPPAAVRFFLSCVQPAMTTAIVLFLMAFSLDASRRREAIRQPAASITGCLINLGLVPLLAWPLSRLQTLPDFEIGLFVTAVVPCTLATASVFTRRAGGNDAVSLMVTLVTNIACVVVTPFWLELYLGRSVGFDPRAMILQLALCVVLPTLLGQMAQLPQFADACVRRYRGPIGLIAQGFVLLLIVLAAVNAGRVLGEQSEWPGPVAVLLMTACCLALHLLGMGAAWFGTAILRISRADRIAIAIAGSQKTLPVGLMIVTSPELTSAVVPFITFPLVVYHAGQLLLDAVLAERWREGNPSAD